MKIENINEIQSLIYERDYLKQALSALNGKEVNLVVEINSRAERYPIPMHGSVNVSTKKYLGALKKDVTSRISEIDEKLKEM